MTTSLAYGCGSVGIIEKTTMCSMSNYWTSAVLSPVRERIAVQVQEVLIAMSTIESTQAVSTGSKEHEASDSSEGVSR